MATYYQPASTRRPGMVTFLVVLIVIIGILLLLAGLALLLFRNQTWLQDAINIDVVGTTVSTGVLVYSIGILIVGLIYLLVAKGLGNGNNVSRALVTILSVLQIIAGVFVLVDNHGLRSTGVGNIVLGVIILLILFSPSANAFFRSR